MTTEELMKDLSTQAKELELLARRTLPAAVGALAKRHFQDNFRKGGFVNGGFKTWQRSKRQSGKGTDAGYTPLLSRQRNLFKGVTYTKSDNRVKIHNNVPYAPTHNWGETVHPNVTPKMRRFAWAKFYEATGAPPKGISRKVAAPKPVKGRKKKVSSIYTPSNLSLNREALMWKGLALTKKTKLTIKMPQRQFIGESKELDEKVSQLIETEVSKIMHK
ncbi:MAG: hypothetical protein SNJ29_11200 [Rikenellaceae bacterium]